MYAILLAILCAALWGSAVPIVKMGYKIMEMSTADTYGKNAFCRYKIFCCIYCFIRICHIWLEA